jgi:HEAT repeat protein
VLTRLRLRLGHGSVGDLVDSGRLADVVYAAEHGGSSVRWQAQSSVKGWPDGLAGAALAFESSAEVVRERAVRDLAAIPGDHRALLALLRRAARERRHDVAIVAAERLARAGDPYAVPALVAQWDADDGDRDAAERLARGLRPEHADTLLEMQLPWGGDVGLRHVLAALAPSCTDQLLARVTDRRKEVRRRAVWALSGASRRDIGDALAARLGDPDTEVRIAALGALSALGIPREEVIKRLSDRDEVVRWRAADTLAATGVRGAYEAVVDRLKREKDEIARGVLVRAAGTLGGEASIPLLRAAMAEAKGKNYRYGTYPSHRAAEALRELGPAGVEVLFECAVDDDPVVRHSAIEQIGSLPRDERVARVLAGALRDDHVYVLAQDAFYGSGRDWYTRWHGRRLKVTQDVLLPMLDDPDPTLRRRAAHSLMSQYEPHVGERIIRLVREDPDREVRFEALHVLAALGHPGGDEVIREYLEDPDEETRERAAKALEHHALSVQVQHATARWRRSA